MSGTIHIFRLDTPDENVQPEYQVSYDTGGTAYSKVYTERKLKEFLRYSLDLAVEQAKSVMHDLRHSGKATLAGIELTSEDLASLEMEQAPTDV